MKKTTQGRALWLQIIISIILLVGLANAGNYFTFYIASQLSSTYAVGTYIYAAIAAVIIVRLLLVLKYKKWLVAASGVVALGGIILTYYTAYDYRFEMQYRGGSGIYYRKYGNDQESVDVYDKWGHSITYSLSGREIKIYTFLSSFNMTTGPKLVIVIDNYISPRDQKHGIEVVSLFSDKYMNWSSTDIFYEYPYHKDEFGFKKSLSEAELAAFKQDVLNELGERSWGRGSLMEIEL